MLTMIIVFLMISSGGVLCAANGKKRYEELLPISCSTIVMLLFLCGIIRQLELGIYLIIGISVLVYIISILLIVKRKSIKTFVTNCFTPAFVCFAIFYIVAILFNYGKLADGWDEFSHWVDIVKAMTSLDDFGTNPNSASLFQSYPPGISLFQYFVQKINGLVTGTVFSEWMAYTAYQVFFMSFFMPFLRKLQYKEPGVILVVAITIFLAPTVIFTNLYTKTYIDPILGILSAVGLATVFVSTEKDGFYSANVLLTIAMLVLAKDAGMLFAAIIAVAYVADSMCRGSNKTNKQKVICTILAVMALLVPKLLWNYNVQSNHAVVQFSAPIDFADLVRVLIGKVDSYRTTTMKNFTHAITLHVVSLGNTNIGLNYVALFAVIMCGIYLICKAYQKKGIFSRRKSTFILTLLSVQTLIYVVGTCVSYMYKFSEGEAVALASFDRYMCVAYLAIWLILILLGLCYIQQMEKKYPAIVIVLSILVCLSPMTEVFNFLKREHVRQSKEIRAPYEEISNKIQQMVDPVSRIYIVAQGDSGINYWILRFNARPNKVSENFSWNISGTDTGEYAVRVISAADWREELCTEFDYVVLYKINDSFFNTYGHLFAEPDAIAENSLYKINLESGLLELVQ